MLSLSSIASFYRNLFRSNQKSSLRPLRDTIIGLAVLSAKITGRMYYFYSKKEASFDSKGADEQYRVFLQNEGLVSKKENPNDSMRIGVIPSFEENTAELSHFLESLKNQQYRNFDLILLKNSIYEVNPEDYDFKIEFLDCGSLLTAIKKIISEKSYSHVMVLNEPCFLYENCMQEFVNELKLYPRTKILYSDEDKSHNGKRTEPVFKPEFSKTLLLSMFYIGPLAVYSVDFLRDKLSSLKEEPWRYELALKASDPDVTHVPKVLYGMTASNSSSLEPYRERVQTFLNEKGLQVKVGIRNNHLELYYLEKKLPFVSIIIPTKDMKLVMNCIKSIKKTSNENLEVIIINTGKRFSVNDNELSVKIINYSEEFNFSKANNMASKAAKGDYLLFLNDDIEIADENWLEKMLFYASLEHVGIVGALLQFPDSLFYKNKIQHRGVLLGVSGPAVHAFEYAGLYEKAGQDWALFSREVSAVTGACMLVKKSIFDELGGFDERFSISFGDVDLCLRAREKGYQTVCCSDTKILHKEGATRRNRHPIEDEMLFLKRWEDAISKGDRFYNPNLSHLDRKFRISPFPSDSAVVSLLLEIVYFRDDLQERFPRYFENIQEVIDWAAIEGVTIDSARTALLPYNRYLAEASSENIRDRARKIYQFNHSLEMQCNYPEVFDGKYDRLYKVILEN